MNNQTFPFRLNCKLFEYLNYLLSDYIRKLFNNILSVLKVSLNVKKRKKKKEKNGSLLLAYYK